MIKYLIIFLFVLSPFSLGEAYEIVAHRGVHQTFHHANLNNKTCTATRIDDTGHDFLENTIRSMRKAFDLGATIVEFDIHPTNERNGAHSMVVFHDWTLNCRTNATCENGCKCDEKGVCVTHDQSLEYLKSLDIGYGYTFNNGKSYPFRGKYFGEMPTLEEALDLLKEYPEKKFLVNQKDKMLKTVESFIKVVSEYPEDVRKRIYFPYTDQSKEKLKKLKVQEEIYQGGGPAKPCFKQYLITGLFGYYPKVCRGKKLFIPIRETLERWVGAWFRNMRVIDLLWGWPAGYVDLAHKHNTKIYASQVDSLEEFKQMRLINLDGIMTNKIEIIGPAAAR